MMCEIRFFFAKVFFVNRLTSILNWFISLVGVNLNRFKMQ
jgi:hypothetical protein